MRSSFLAVLLDTFVFEVTWLPITLLWNTSMALLAMISTGDSSSSTMSEEDDKEL